MAIIVSNIKLSLEDPDFVAIEKAVRILKISQQQVQSAHIYKKSIDARNRKQILFVVSVMLHLSGNEKLICEKRTIPNVRYYQQEPLSFSSGKKPLRTPVYIVGFGPAGMFAAYALAKNGYAPIVLERGYEVSHRTEVVERFWRTGELDPQSNVQFGEGGAGTFSDGKLTTRISDPKSSYVLDVLHAFGAPDDILVQSKPHIGTDKLRIVVQKLREEIQRLGGKICFAHKMEQIYTQNGTLQAITVNGETIPCKHLVLALGHSARDTFTMLAEQGVALSAKDFSVGVRIEHLQTEIDHGLYGNLAGHPNLPQGEYQLSYREDGRGVYTFCMCPGGLVVPSSSSEQTVVTNGMSEYLRDQENANSAVVVSVSSKDFGNGVLDGMFFQQKLEREAFIAGGNSYRAPASTVDAFFERSANLRIQRVHPSYALGVEPYNLHNLFPVQVSDMLEKGLRNFDHKIKGFAAKDSVLTGVETRTSSPVRILRDKTLQSTTVKGLYPCGEGAGYAGGIISAAVDGLRVAEKIISEYRVEKV